MAVRPAFHHNSRTGRSGRTRVRVVLGLIMLGIGVGVLYQMHLSNLAYFVVISESMEPTIRIGDRLIMERPRLYDRGQIVVLEKPGDPRRLLVKRIVAMYPDQVSLRGGLLYVNGQHSIPPEGEGAPSDYDDDQWTLARGQVFVVGDNRPDSGDSRDFGPVSLDALHGVVTYRVVSLFNWTRVR